MRGIRRALVILVILAAIIVLVPAGLIGGIIVWIKTSPPPTSGEVKLPTLTAPVDVVWDENAVPHIFAKTLRDAYRTMGWVHARDRLWQMETQRRIGQGRLSELVGKVGLDFDKEMRVLGVYRLAEETYKAMSPEAQAEIAAYAEGVNAYLAHPAAPLPIEFQLLHATPEPWRPADTLVWGRLMALQLSGNYREEVVRAALVRKLPRDVYDDLFPNAVEPGPMTLGALSDIDWKRFARHLPAVLGPSQASNEWVVDGTQTKGGKPMLANDPHLGLAAPILWYLARVVTPELAIAGATFPGVPYHILGQNGHVAWGVTTTGGDVQDLFVEDVMPNDTGRYKTPDGDAPFKVRDEVIKVRFGADIHLRVRETRHGPVISDIDPELAAAAGKGKVVALSFVGLMPDDVTVEAIRGLDHAQNVQQFREALKMWRSPEQNIVYADTDGHIGFTTVGPVPIRKRPTEELPAPGSSGEWDWLGLAEFDQLPQSMDPPSHRFVNANNRVVPPDYPIFITRQYDGDSFRAIRIADMLDSGHAYTVDDFVRMQADTKEQDADTVLPRLLIAAPKTDAGRHALALLQGWDRMMAADRPEPLIYNAWFVRLQKALIVRRLGAQSDLAPAGYNPNLLIRLLDKDMAKAGADATKAVISAALDDAVAALGKTYGDDMGSWRWGKAHRASLTSQLFGSVPLLGGLFDAGLPAPGGADTVNRAAWGRTDGVTFTDMHGPGFRGVFDLSNLDASKMVIASGESGNPLSPHYADLSVRWRNGEGITLSGTEAEVAARGLGTQHFSP
ncbi:MAG TPA: penicillin acylase family protein [Alphaproteobacteria bacterium]|nr:penicillin acylase family protein [Alphaproteobacteria bacterium]